jgi:hypothetical protein
MEEGFAEKWPEMNCLTFATPEDAKKAESLFNKMQGRIDMLSSLVRLLEWGSCDGCGNHAYCPLCSQAKESMSWDEDEPVNHAGFHKPDCPVKIALG